MTIRPARAEDLPALAAMLRAEGVPDGDMRVHGGMTAVLDDDGPRGCFTLETIDGWLHLRHFVVGREHRAHARARALIRAVCRTAREAGFTDLLVHANDERADRFIRYWWRTEPYGRSEDGASFYRVGTGV